MKNEQLLRVPITVASKEEIIEYITTSLQNKSKKFYIVTPNPEIVMFAQKHPDFMAILNKAEVSLPDGIGVVWGSRLLKKSVKIRISGVDVMEELCEKASRKGLIVGFLGGRGGVADKTAQCLVKKYPGLRVGFIGEEWDHKLKIINHKSKIDILFVAYGFPKQEEWIADNLPHIPVTCAMGVGGAFDFIGGKVSRAPLWVRQIGLEWLFRLVVQPWRWRRQLVLIEYMILVIKEYFKIKLRSNDHVQHANKHK